MRFRWSAVPVLAGAFVIACGADRPAPAPTLEEPVLAAPSRLVASAAVERRALQIRARFALPQGVAERFEVGSGNDRAHAVAVLPSAAHRGVRRAATVALPLNADGEVRVVDERSRLSIGFALEGVHHAPIATAGGLAMYVGAAGGADVVHRVHAEGTEDYVVFETRPDHESLTYSVDVSRVAGLRLVSQTLEFLDRDGTPVLRVAPPYVVDAHGTRSSATLAISGCAYDTNPAGPWGRAVVPAGATRCSVHVGWSGLPYPLMVDPAWVATGSMGKPRSAQLVTLQSGRVLVPGGATDASAELFDAGGDGGIGTFAATGPLTKPRGGHTATLLASGKVLLIGGGNSVDGLIAATEVYDPIAGTFATSTPLLFGGRSGHTASVLKSGKILVVGGGLASTELYDPAGAGGAGSFSTPGSMVVARSSHTATVLTSGKVLVTGGRSPVPVPPYGVLLASAELYDPATNNFTNAGSVGMTREGHTAGVLPSGLVVIAGGFFAGSAGGYTRSATTFDPTTERFGPSGPLVTVAGLGAAAALLPSGLFFFGGESMDRYDPVAQAFTASAPLVPPRFVLNGAVLPSGKLLIAGGSVYDGQLTILSSAQILGGSVADACVADGNCLSGHCVDGVCCATACDGGACQACSASAKQDGSADGTCGLAKPGAVCAASSCTGTQGVAHACDAGGTCRATTTECGIAACAAGVCAVGCTTSASCASGAWCNGGTCSARVAKGAACGSSDACASGFCIDGVCCDRACGGQCEACDATPGTCTAINGTPHGARPACAADSACNASRSGTRCESTTTPPAAAVPPGPAPTPASFAAAGGGCALGSTPSRAPERTLVWLAVMTVLVLVRRRLVSRAATSTR